MLLITYLQRIIAFTLRGSVKQADNWQVIVAGTALPSLVLGLGFSLAGQEMPVVEPTTYATYLGYGLLAWLGIRFIIAPFFIWREEFQKVAALNLELSKPERIELEHLHRMRVKSRLKLSALVRQIVMATGMPESSNQSLFDLAKRVAPLVGKAGGQASLNDAVARLMIYCGDYTRDRDERLKSAAITLSHDIVEYLHGRITGETLALRLPPSLEEETPPQEPSSTAPA